MKTVFTTEHGSTYEIDHETKVWCQLIAGADKDPTAPLRTIGGPFISVSEVRVGLHTLIVAPPYIEGAVLRLITTSPVVSIKV